MKNSGLFDEVYYGGSPKTPPELDEVRFIVKRTLSGTPTPPFWQDLVLGIDVPFIVVALPATGGGPLAILGAPLLAMLVVELPLFFVYGEWSPPFDVGYELSVVGHGETVFANYHTTRRIAVDARLGLVMDEDLPGLVTSRHESKKPQMADAALAMSDEPAIQELLSQLLEDREVLSRVGESLPTKYTPIKLAGLVSLKTAETPPSLRAGVATHPGEPPAGYLVRNDPDHLDAPLPGQKPRLTIRCEVAERPGEDMELWSGALPKDGRVLLKRTHWGTVKSLGVRVEVDGFAPVEEKIDGPEGAFVAVLESAETEAK